MDAKEVALFFIDIFNKDNRYKIDNLKLNKLLYFAQGWYLSRYNKKLFSDSIEAWPYGPVVPNVYRLFNFFGKNEIVADADVDAFDESVLSSQELVLLIDVYNEYSKYTGGELIDMTHQNGSPWKQIYDPNEIGKEIPVDLIKDYFNKQNKIPSIEDINFNKLEEIGRIDTDGHLVLPVSEK